MIKREQVINYPIINLNDGAFIGQVSDVVIDPKEIKVVGFEIADKSLFRSKNKYIMFNDVKTIGNFAITILNRSQLVTDENQVSEHFIRDRFLLGKRMINPFGTFLGKVKNFSFEIQSGKLVTFYLSNENLQGECLTIQADNVLTLGKDVIIANMNLPGPAKMSKEQVHSTPGKSPAKTIQEKAMDYALGKQVYRTVRDSQGGIIIKQGEFIRPEVLDLAREKNRLAHLLFAAGVNEVIEGLDYTREIIDEGSRKLLDTFNRLKEETGYTSNKTASTPTDMKSTVSLSDIDDKLYDFWHNNLVRIFNEMDFDYETRSRIKNYIKSKVPAYKIQNSNGELIKNKNEVITEEDLEKIHRTEDMISLLAAVSAYEIKSFSRSLEDRLVNQVKKSLNQNNKILK